MIEADKRSAVFLLHKEGMALREIARRLALSRNTVRLIIEQGGLMPVPCRRSKLQLDPELLRELYERCHGWIERVRELLEEEHGLAVKYSTLTRILRELAISNPPSSRCDQVPDQPGAEMQHDTSPYRIPLAGRPLQLIASLLYLRFSKRRYLKFYRVFNRFRMKCFLHEALMFWRYCAPDCIIDNTSLARLRGTGRNAIIVAEMEAFAKQYGFRFVCHEIGHANRKAGEERSFYTVESNFLPGRSFASLEDLNAQALEWATVRMEQRPQGKARLVPARAFEHESAYLVRLPPHLPAPCRAHHRDTDQYGYASFQANYYWVPGTTREAVRLLEYSDRLKIYRLHECLAEYPLPPDGVKNAKFSPEGQPKPRYQPHRRRQPTQEEEQALRAMGDPVGRYLDFALQPKGIQRHRLVRELFALSRLVTPALFAQTLERAQRYRIVELPSLHRIAHRIACQAGATLPSADVDETLQERDSYREGRLSDSPDFSPYDQLLEQNDE
ncbi:MAG TPA: hypothetical protein PLN33_12975 [Hyphomonadaceae bacterium]|nr:hypothetical protein [Hyphomonadaceae bacterium]